MMKRTGVNTSELGNAVRRRREELNLSLRDVADETGVSASTLSRIENGTGKPDADNIARLTSWLNMPMERVLAGRHPDTDEASAVVYYPHESTPEIVEAHLRADRNLTAETASALSELFRVAYAQFSRAGQSGRKRRLAQSPATSYHLAQCSPKNGPGSGCALAHL